jgi:hypothetical protein
MNTIFQHLLGTNDIPKFIACVFFAMIGTVISLLVHATNRDKNSMKTPYKFSFVFLIADNWQRILLNLLLILVTIRFCKEITGMELSMFVSLLIGVGYDKLGEFLRNKCFIDTEHPKNIQ